MGKKSDLLYFEHLGVSSAAFYREEAKRTIWRMVMEVTMVLVSTILARVFVWFQLNHVKGHPNAFPFILLFMLLIATFGHIIPLILNFEAISTKKKI